MAKNFNANKLYESIRKDIKELNEIKIGSIVQILDKEGNTVVIPKAKIFKIEDTNIGSGTVKSVEITGLEDEDKQEWYSEDEYEIVVLNEQKKEEEDPTKPARNLLRRIHKATDKDTLEKLLDQLEKDGVSGKINTEQETRLKAALDRRGKKLEENPEAPVEEPTEAEVKDIEECKVNEEKKESVEEVKEVPQTELPKVETPITIPEQGEVLKDKTELEGGNALKEEKPIEVAKVETPTESLPKEEKIEPIKQEKVAESTAMEAWQLLKKGDKVIATVSVENWSGGKKAGVAIPVGTKGIVDISYGEDPDGQIKWENGETSGLKIADPKLISENKTINLKKLPEGIMGQGVQLKRVNSNGTSLQGYFPEGTTYANLVKVFGEPNVDTTGYDKVDAEWSGIVDGEVFIIYNYKTGKNYLGEKGSAVENITDWHIGGFKEEIVSKLLDYFKLDKPVESKVNEADKEKKGPSMEEYQERDIKSGDKVSIVDPGFVYSNDTRSATTLDLRKWEKGFMPQKGEIGVVDDLVTSTAGEKTFIVDLESGKTILIGLLGVKKLKESKDLQYAYNLGKVMKSKGQSEENIRKVFHASGLDKDEIDYVIKDLEESKLNENFYKDPKYLEFKAKLDPNLLQEFISVVDGAVRYGMDQIINGHKEVLNKNENITKLLEKYDLKENDNEDDNLFKVIIEISAPKEISNEKIISIIDSAIENTELTLVNSPLLLEESKIKINENIKLIENGTFCAIQEETLSDGSKVYNVLIKENEYNAETKEEAYKIFEIIEGIKLKESKIKNLLEKYNLNEYKYDNFEISGEEAIIYSKGVEVDRVDLDSLVKWFLEDQGHVSESNKKEEDKLNEIVVDPESDKNTLFAEKEVVKEYKKKIKDYVSINFKGIKGININPRNDDILPDSISFEAETQTIPHSIDIEEATLKLRKAQGESIRFNIPKGKVHVNYDISFKVTGHKVVEESKKNIIKSQKEQNKRK